MANASGDSSARNASTSSGVGGSPVRSNVARRIRTRLSAGRAGFRPSLLERGKDESVDRVPRPARHRRTCGTLGLRTGWNAQNARCSGVMTYARRRWSWSLPRSPARPRRPSPTRPWSRSRRLGSLPAGRHLEARVRPPHRLDQQAFVGIAGHDRRARICRPSARHPRNRAAGRPCAIRCGRRSNSSPGPAGPCISKNSPGSAARARAAATAIEPSSRKLRISTPLCICYSQKGLLTSRRHPAICGISSP